MCGTLDKKTTTPSRLRYGSLQHSPPGTPVRPPRKTLDFKSQEASRVRFPGLTAVTPPLPVCPALVTPFCDHNLLLERASLGLHIPERSRVGVGCSLGFGVWRPGMGAL